MLRDCYLELFTVQIFTVLNRFIQKQLSRDAKSPLIFISWFCGCLYLDLAKVTWTYDRCLFYFPALALAVSSRGGEIF